MNKRFNSVPRLKIAASLQIDQQTKGNSPLASPTPRRMVTESVYKQNSMSKLSCHDQWKPERLIKYLKHKIMDRGINSKQGLREIFLIYNYKVFKYFIPTYLKTESENELITDFIEQQLHLKALLNLKLLPKLWTLDGFIIKNFYPFDQKVIYVNTFFDFWQMIANVNEYEGKFQGMHDNQLRTEIQLLQNQKEVEDFFFSHNLLQRFYKTSVISTTKLPLISSRSKIELDDHEIETAFSMLNSEKQRAKVQIYHQLNREQISRSNHAQKSRKLIRFPLKIKTRQSIEQQILCGNITDPFELQQQVQEQVEDQNLFIFSSPDISRTEREVSNPFQLKTKLSEPSLIQNVNIDKIQMDYKITRRQTINFLTIFKCLLNREHQPHQFQISKANLLLAYPYLVMEGQSCGYDAFYFVKDTKLKQFTFEDFVKIFTLGKI